jgi:hypothetical protein
MQGLRRAVASPACMRRAVMVWAEIIGLLVNMLDMSMMRRTFCSLSALLLFGFALLFAAAFYDRYWRWRDCFNELGRCYDPATQTVMTDAAFVWGVMAAMAFMLSALMFMLRGRVSP